MLITEGLNETAFRIIAAGEILTTTVDLAQVYDLSAGGSFDFLARATFSLAELDSTAITKTFLVESNTITAIVDGSEAAAAQQADASRDMHSLIKDIGCSDDQMAMLNAAREFCRERAHAAYYTASEPDSPAFSKVREFFKDESKMARDKIAEFFATTYWDCDTPFVEGGRHFCSDCSDYPVVAYADTARGRAGYCPIYFEFDAQNEGCHDADRPHVLMHELSHLFAGTTDTVYGYENLIKLSSSQALNNADTYAHFAKGKSLDGRREQGVANGLYSCA